MLLSRNSGAKLLYFYGTTKRITDFSMITLYFYSRIPFFPPITEENTDVPYFPLISMS